MAYIINPATKKATISVNITELSVATNTLQFLMTDTTHKIKKSTTHIAKYINILPIIVSLMTDSLSSTAWPSGKPPYFAYNHTNYKE